MAIYGCSEEHLPVEVARSAAGASCVAADPPAACSARTSRSAEVRSANGGAQVNEVVARIKRQKLARKLAPAGRDLTKISEAMDAGWREIYPWTVVTLTITIA